MDEEKINQLADEKLAKLLSVIDYSRVISMDRTAGLIYIGGKEADSAYLQNLKQEAEALLISDLWKIIFETPKALAEKAMFVEGKTLDDLVKGRAMLYTLDNQKNILTTLTQVK